MSGGDLDPLGHAIQRDDEQFVIVQRRDERSRREVDLPAVGLRQRIDEPHDRLRSAEAQEFERRTLFENQQRIASRQQGVRDHRSQTIDLQRLAVEGAKRLRFVVLLRHDEDRIAMADDLRVLRQAVLAPQFLARARIEHRDRTASIETQVVRLNDRQATGELS